MAKLSLKHLYKIYDNGTKAVDDFNLEIGDDEFVVFVGPSGCGKSTTLRMIAGLEDITAGDFLIDGILANNLEPKDRDMAMVFQNYALYPHMTVYDNMSFGLRINKTLLPAYDKEGKEILNEDGTPKLTIRHYTKKEIDARVQEAARMLDIADQLTKKPKEMSGGQRQRVALGRAIVRKPKVFLLDEPLSNLDAKLRSSMRSEIINLHNRLGTTFIYVTHDQIEAMTMGTRIVVMKKGVIQQVDTPMNLYDYPENLFVASFIGTPQMNFLEANIFFKDNSYVLDFGDFSIESDMALFRKLDLANVLQKTKVKVGIRPEHILLADEGEKNSFKATISIIESLGNEANFLLKTMNGEHSFTARLLRNDALKVGDTICVKFDLEKIHLFDIDSENTLLPRVPTNSVIKAEYLNGFFKIFNKKIPILERYKAEIINGTYYLHIPNSSYLEGKDYSLPMINKECINKKWLITMKSDGGYLNYYSEKYIDSDIADFSLDWSKISVYDEKYQCVIPAMIEENIIDGTLVPVKKPMTLLNGTLYDQEEAEEKINNSSTKIKSKIKNMKVFDYEIFGQTYTPNDKSIIKIYSLLGKKFALHNIKFTIPCESFSFASEGIEGIIKDIYEYSHSKFYRIEIGDKEIVVKSNESHDVGETVLINFDINSIGVFDVNFGVKLI